MKKETRSDGTMIEQEWDCCHLLSRNGADGMTTAYSYDGLDRMVREERDGPNGNKIITATDYSASGNERITLRTVSDGSGNSLSTKTVSDLAGRTIYSEDAAGLKTQYAYSEDGLTTTVTRPGDVTEITERYADGRTKSVTGTGVVPRYYTYATDTDGTQITTVYTGDGGAASPMWERTVVDGLGRTIRAEKPGYGGVTLVTENIYDDKGRSVRTVAPSQADTADTVYAYDPATGAQYRSGLDLDGSGGLEPGSDRMTESRTFALYEDDALWQVSDQFVFDETGKKIRTARQKQRMSGLGTSGDHGILVGESVSVDIHGNETISTSWLDRDAFKRTQVTDYPDSENDAVSVSVRGVVTETRSRSGLVTAFDYDGLGRRTGVTDPRTGRSVTAYDAVGRLDYVEDAASNRTTFGYDPETGRKVWEKNAKDKYTRYAYNNLGQVTKTWGDAVYPVKYVYDDFGSLSEMHTFRDDAGWSSETWPTGGTADVTKWHYENATGLLTAKEYADGTQTQYAYTPEGKLDIRTWARTKNGNPLKTDYDYNPDTGELLNIDYSDETPDIAFVYDGLGRKKTVTDAVGTRTFAYNDALQPESETITGLYNTVLTRTYDDDSGVKGRSNGFTLGTADAPEYAVTYGYEAATGRFSTVSWNAGTENGIVNYSYVQDSDLLAGYSTDSGIGTSYTYEDHRNLKTAVENTYDVSIVSRYAYKYDELGRRTSVVNTGNAFTESRLSKYGYNDRSEVISSERYEGENPDAPGTAVTDESRSYNYDPIGNRKTSVAGTQQAAIYTTNVLNQYTDISGGETASPAYDDDGNMTEYDGAVYTWNAENRLVSVEMSDRKVEFLYDYTGRRVRKQVYTGAPDTWSLESEKLFVYDGWNLVKEIDSTGDSYYVWGSDLSQSLQGAGGIGGLLCSVNNEDVFYYAYDANGNVGQLIDGGGNIFAHYEYDPFGKTVVKAGSFADANPFQFSTKYFNAEIGFYYYGFRYYAPEPGRWLRRDPIAEQGGVSLYGFVLNNPIRYADLNGLDIVDDIYDAIVLGKGLLTEPIDINLSFSFGNRVGNCDEMYYNRIANEIGHLTNLMRRWAQVESAIDYWYVRDPRTAPHGTLDSVNDGSIYATDSEWEFAFSEKGQAAIDRLGEKSGRYENTIKNVEARVDRWLKEYADCVISKKKKSMFILSILLRFDRWRACLLRNDNHWFSRRNWIWNFSLCRRWHKRCCLYDSMRG